MYGENIPLILTLNDSNLLANTIWAVIDSTATLIVGIFGFCKLKNYRKKNVNDKDILIDSQKHEIAAHNANDAVKTQLEAFEDKFDEKIDAMNKILSKINYAIFNAGKTGLVNKVDSMLENQTEMIVAIEVLKAKSEK